VCIDHAAAVAGDRDDLLGTVETVLSYMSSYGDAAIQATIAAHAAAQGAWLHGPGAGLTGRLDTVLNGTVTDEKVAERMLGYPVSDHHVAVIVWVDDTSGRQLDLAAADGWWQALSGVRGALVVPRDERTLLCWLHVPDGARMDEWVEIAAEQDRASRVAFGELGVGIEGFCLSNAQARAAANVLALARKEVGSVVRYRDVSAISFLAYQPAKSRAWVQGVLGDLAGAGGERDRLRHTLHVFLQEGEKAAVASRRLFVHRNTLRYRIDRASQMLPRPIEDRRLDVMLALSYCEWVPVWDMHYVGSDPPSRDAASYVPSASNGREREASDDKMGQKGPQQRGGFASHEPNDLVSPVRSP
jgi:DNA-binding PucR family transcriptional regulator